MAKKKALIDLDQTLVHTKPLESGRPVPPGWSEIVFGPMRYASIVRPSASAFLHALKQKEFAVCLLTSGKPEFQSLVLELFDLRQLFDAVYGRDSDLTDVSVPWVLVDDLAPPCAGIEDKFAQLGIFKSMVAKPVWEQAISTHLVTCSAFWRGKEPDSLTTLLPLIDEKISLQSAAIAR